MKTRHTVLFNQIRTILESARTNVARSVNSTQVVANWLIGYTLVTHQQNGKNRAEYGKALLKELSSTLKKEFGSGYSVDNLEHFRRFYTEYPELISDALPRKSQSDTKKLQKQSTQAETADSSSVFISISEAVARNSSVEYRNAWQPGKLCTDLSWTHYRMLLKVKRREIRDFYEIETRKNSWSSRQLERQIDSLLFERLLKSRDKDGVKALANEGLEPGKPIDTIKDPYILEFLDIPQAHQLIESKVEEALITRLTDFLLELGTGFAFVARQKRLTLDGDHFYSDLVFYNIKLKCYLIIDLKTAKLTHGDLGQMQMYVNYYDREIRGEDDNPTIGLILCTAKNDSMVQYVLDDKNKQIFASRYQFTLPSEEDLRRELENEMVQLGLPSSKTL